MTLKIDLKATAPILKNFTDDLEQKLRGINTHDITVAMSDIEHDAYIILVEYFTEVESIAEFTRKKQEVNLMILELLDAKGLKLSGKEKLVLSRDNN